MHYSMYVVSRNIYLPVQKDYLERQLADVEERFGRDINNYQDQIDDLGAQLEKIKSEMAERLREYQDLLAVKLSKDVKQYRPEHESLF